MFSMNYLPLLTPLAAGIVAWIGRRRIGSIWRAVGEAKTIRQNLATCEAERDYLYQALKELTSAARQVKAVEEAGLLTISAPSENAPFNSPANLSRSRTRRRRPLIDRR